MQYVYGTPYFCSNFKKIKQYKYLNSNIDTDILIVGGGVCGAILNYYLSQKYDVILIDKGRLGQCCTSCATALLEYQLDEFYSKLKKQFKENEIIEIYKIGLKSLKKIEKFVKIHGNECNFYKRHSLLYTTKEQDYKLFKDEYDFRKKYKFQCEFLTKNNNYFEFPLTYGLYCKNGGGELNPYLFTKQLIENSQNQDRIFENTGFESFYRENGKICARTNYNQIITCNKIIFATGFDIDQFENNDLMNRYITYSIVTNKLTNFNWHENATIHDNTQPYHYLRMLPDNRIIYGGEDLPFKKSNMKDEKCEQKYNILLQNLIKMFPSLKEQVKIDYKFCGCFGTTENNLGLIGETDISDIFMFLSCGANGIINAMYGVELIENLLKGKSNKLDMLFTPLRVIN